MSGKAIAFVLFLLALAMALPLRAERVALVIGNGAYGGEVSPLPNPGNDARAMAAKLRGLGFSVVEGTDLDRGGFFSKMKEFSRRAEDAEAALLFYAGHGVQVEGKNYLIPVSMETLESKTDLREDAVNLDYVLDEMKGRTNLVFLDACRNNPFRSMRGSGSGGLAIVSAKLMRGGVLIGYAADPGDVASDGSGKNSPYTEALLKHLGTPGESAVDMLTRVKADVEDATGGKQHPWTNVSMREPFHFVPGSAGMVVGPSPVSTVEPGGCDTELLKLIWDESKDSRNERELEAFIADYESCRGAGALVARARNLLEERAEEAHKKREAKELRRPGSRFRDCGACPEMVVIPAGSFLMGSPESEEGRGDDEGPLHRVTIGEAFAVGVYEITVAEYREFVSAEKHDGGMDCAVDAGKNRIERIGSWRNPGFEQTDSAPVVCVSWDDAQAYVRWLSRKTGEWYRLLSEAEWEYAARAGTTTRYSFGDEITSRDANYGGNIGQPQRVGIYERANGYGLHDMHGNVWEWVQDCWNESYAGVPDNGDEWETGACLYRVLRGGSWLDFRPELRSANREGDLFKSARSVSGFRVALKLRP